MMAMVEARGGAAVVVRRSWPRWAGYGALAALAAAWTFRALHDPYPWDTGLAYSAGQVAWTTGHPEHLASWISTPFLGVVMAVLSRGLSVRGVADLVTVVNLVLWVGGVAWVLRSTRRLLSPVWWWVLAFGLMSYVPLMSSVWFKQFNVIVLVLAAAGFELVRRERVSWGAALIGLSISVKPLLVLLPVVMLARRDTRRAGLLAVVWVIALNVAAQAFLAIRAHDHLATLNPWIGAHNFLVKNKPGFAICLPLNFSPTAMLCRAAGGGAHWNVLRAAGYGAVALLGAWSIDALRGRRADSWEVFAFVGPLSVMLSPVEWTHYQILLAPLFVLLLVRFTREGAGIGAWTGLALAFALASLIWQPYGSLTANIGRIFTSERWHEPTTLEGAAQFSQYVLLLSGALWYARRRVRPGPASGSVAAEDPLR